MDLHSHSDNFPLQSPLRSTPPHSNIPNTNSFTAAHTKGKKGNEFQEKLNSDVVELSRQDTKLAELQARDREVRAHEAAHSAAAGSLSTGGPQFTFQRGSDGQLYAVGGEVNIDTSPVAGDPHATIQKAQRIRSAALAPANPSARDRAVAAQATRLEAQAHRELQQERTDRIQDSVLKKFTPTLPPPQILDLFA